MNFTSLTTATDRRKLREGFDQKTFVGGEAVERDRFRALWPKGFFKRILAFSSLSEENTVRVLLRGEEVAHALYRDDQFLPKADAIRKLQRVGATIALCRVDGHSNCILALIRSLENELHCPIQVNCYITAGNSNGISAHADSHDVLILQLAGEKHWLLGDEGDGKQQQSTVVKAGDWIFVPQGMRHEVTNRAPETSVHLTIGFNPPTWGGLLEHALTQVRKSNPSYHLPMELADKRMEKTDAVKFTLESMAPFIDPFAFKKKFMQDFHHLSVAVPEFDLGFMGDEKLVGENDVLLWNCGSEAVSFKRMGVCIHRPYRRYPVVLRPEWRGTIERFADAGEFRTVDLDLRPNSDLLEFCRFLIGLGVLRLKVI